MPTSKNFRLIVFLGKIARMLRKHGLGSFLQFCGNLLDFFFYNLSITPLSVRYEDFTLHGFLRHRGFLEKIGRRNHEKHATNIFIKLLRPSSTVIDGGAHIGLYTLFTSKFGNGMNQVFAFEPDPYNFKALKINCRRNSCKNVKLIPKALSNNCEGISLYRSQNTISSSIINRTDIGATDEIQIETTTADTELSEIHPKSLAVKLDVEGAEVLAISGMENTIRAAQQSMILMEINPSALAAANLHPERQIEAIEKLGFKIHFINEKHNQIIPIAQLNTLEKGNYLCTRNIEIEHYNISDHS